VLFTSAWAFEDRVRSAVEQGTRGFEEVVNAFVQRGDLTVSDSVGRGFAVWRRFWMSGLCLADLPGVVGRWCVAPLAGLDLRLP
jgi:hypothetical protein